MYNISLRFIVINRVRMARFHCKLDSVSTCLEHPLRATVVACGGYTLNLSCIRYETLNSRHRVGPSNVFYILPSSGGLESYRAVMGCTEISEEAN